MNAIPTSSISSLADAMHKLEQDIALAAQSDARVLVTGNSSASRKFVAQLIHQRSRRSSGPFIVINGTDIARSHSAGEGDAATALRLSNGLAEASDGTLFIQEIEQIPAPAQRALL